MSGTAKCERCGGRFSPAKPWARYCSDACRIQAHRAKNRTVAVAGLTDAESSLVDALTAVREGRTGAALSAARRAVETLEAVPRRRRASALDDE
jgi:hypothetical protein